MQQQQAKQAFAAKALAFEVHSAAARWCLNKVAPQGTVAAHHLQP
jgi:hypothetical protein